MGRAQPIHKALQLQAAQEKAVQADLGLTAEKGENTC